MSKQLGVILTLFLCVLFSERSEARIRLNLGGAKYPTVAGDLSVSITVDTLTPTVAVGTAADQSFRDDSVGAAFFGYYLTLGIRTQLILFNGINIKIQRGGTETAGRSYYLLGNGTSVPNDQTDLTQAPATATTFATTPINTIRCGPNWSANGASGGGGLNCTGNPTVANMDITQFVKVLFTDVPSTPIRSMLSFTVVNE